jgi:hypothetical protein
MFLTLVSVSAEQSFFTLEDIKAKISKDSSPREALVQWYYAIEDLTQAVREQAPASPTLTKLTALQSGLRQELNTKKSLLTATTGSSQLLSLYWSGVLTVDKSLEDPCPQYDVLVDDRSYALDIPPSLVMATWLMESGCRRSRPSNGDGIFQIVSKDYGTGDITTGHWIWMMYDFNDFLRAKFAWYQKANNLTQVLPMSYRHIDYDSIIKFGALYNGLSWATVKWNILPAAPNYVFWKLTDQYSWSSKDGLLVRVMKVLKYMN